MGFTLTALVMLATVRPALSCDTAHYLLEQALGQTPEAQVRRYLAAISKEDRQQALSLWPGPATPNGALEARRASVTDELLGYGPELQYQVLDIVWWRTCCEPGVIDDPDEAGGANIRVAIRREGQPEVVYLFDVLVPGGYWGAAAGSSIRKWTLVDAYPEEANPLAWPWR
jgi:hypothetical protein